ncbi:MAG: cation:proton antiporter [Pseudomonadota bacterium]
MESTVSIVALIGVLGIGSQWLAWRFNLPAIVLMSVAGLLAGPVFQVIDPARDFDGYLQPIVGIAVAIILFEGGLSLDFKELAHAGRGVARLVVPGVPIAWGLGSLAAHYVAGLSWPVAILFAGILVVTGPTVIIPLLRQARLAVRPRTMLKWEGIVNDPLGALLAVLVYEYMSYAGEGRPLLEISGWMLFASTVAGLVGFAMARAVAYVFPRGLVPEFLKAPVLLCAVLACFALANAIEHETGLLAVTAMGVTMANSRIASIDDLRRFKENIAVLLVSGVFVILTATLQGEVWAGIDWRLAVFTLVILFIVRPASVWLATWRSGLSWQERALVGWIAPRGIVAVAVSGFFALRLSELGYPDAARLVPLSFAIVFATILAHGFTVGRLARHLDLSAQSAPGVLIVGSSPWSVELAKLLKSLNVPAAIADTSWHRLRLARLADVPVYYGEILSEVTEHRFDMARFGYLLAVTGNEAYNALVCREFAPELGRERVFQLGQAESDDPHGLSFTIRGGALLRSGLALDELLKRHFAGWAFYRTRLTEKFLIEDYLADRPKDAETLFILRRNGALAFAPEMRKAKVEAGDVIIAYSPPRKDEPVAAPAAQPSADNPPPLPA